VLAFSALPNSAVWLVNNSYKLSSRFISISVFLRRYGYRPSAKTIVHNSLSNSITSKSASLSWRSLKQRSKQHWGHRTSLFHSGSSQTQPAAFLPHRPAHKRVYKPSCLACAPGSAASSYNQAISVDTSRFRAESHTNSAGQHQGCCNNSPVLPDTPPSSQGVPRDTRHPQGVAGHWEGQVRGVQRPNKTWVRRSLRIKWKTRQD
jgi:hypothetical protein